LFKEMKIALNMPDIEVYISHGEKAIGINGYEAQPSFIIIGGDHLDKNSLSYLTNSELKFALGVEFAHIYFKHSRITSTDLWRGAIEKGNWLLDAFMTVFPVLGLVGKSIGYLTKLNAFADVVQKAEKVTKYTSGTKNLLGATEQASEFYKKVKKKDQLSEKEQELLATSRLMQLTADRMGLLFGGDLKMSIRTIFLTSKKYSVDLANANKIGLSNYLLQQNPDNNYKNQELAIRISNLFSFYLSDEYESLKKELYE
jgi:hypothetical protein